MPFSEQFTRPTGLTFSPSPAQTIVRAREQLTARRPTKSDWAEEDRRARSPPAEPKRKLGIPFFSPRKNPDGSERVAAKRMSRKDVRRAEEAEARQKERAAALKVTKPSASSTSNPSGAASTSSDVEAASRAAAGSSATVAWVARLVWSTLVFVALLAVAFVVCVHLDQRGAFPDVMTPRSMRAFAERAAAAAATGVGDLSASADACAAGARAFGAAVAMRCADATRLVVGDLSASVDACAAGARAFGAAVAMRCADATRLVAARARVFGAAFVVEGGTAVRAVRAVVARTTSAFER